VRMSAEELERLTPASRDRYVDFLRAFSIVVVVIGHWTIALIFWEDARIFVHNVVGHQSGLWLATWVLQVMPLFFFVGGFSNAQGWNSTISRHGSYGQFMTKRLLRLLRPTAVFVVVWLVVEAALALRRYRREAPVDSLDVFQTRSGLSGCAGRSRPSR